MHFCEHQLQTTDTDATMAYRALSEQGVWLAEIIHMLMCMHADGAVCIIIIIETHSVTCMHLYTMYSA